jgi:translocation and assembly module TamB
MSLWGFRVTIKAILQLGVLTLLSFGIGFSYNYHLPKFEAFLLKEIKEQSRLNSPIHIQAEELHFQLIPVSVVLKNVSLAPSQEIDSYVAPAKVQEVKLQLSVWAFLHGDVRLSQVYIHDADFTVFLREELFAKSANKTPTHIDFDELYKLPIDEILLENIQVQGKLEPQNVVFKITQLDLDIENRYKSIFIDINAPKALIKPSGPINPLNVQLQIRLLAEANEIQISAIKMRADESYLVASGRFNGDVASLKFDQGAFEARSRVNLSDINIWERVFFLKPTLPKVQGHLDGEMAIEIPKSEVIHVKSATKIKDLKIDKYTIGNATGKFETDLKTLTSPEVTVENAGGKLQLQKLNVALKSPMAGSVHAKVTAFDIRKFLQLIQAGHVPIFAPVNGSADCNFVLSDNPDLNCQTQLEAPKARIESGPPENKVIIEAGNVRAHGSAKVNKQQVQYSGELMIGKKSRATSSGVINYDTGFKILYTADMVDFADVKNLVNLKFEGTARMAGETIGTAKWATVKMKMDGENLWLEDYPFGTLQSKVDYKDGHLLLSQVQGHIGVTRYNGWIDMDLPNARLRLSGQIPFMELKDMRYLFSRKVELPFDVNGTGTGQVEAEGPFEFTKMSYTFRSNFYRGQIARESFDEFVFNVKAIDGYATQEKIKLTKSAGVLDVKGQINPKGEIDAVAIGRGLRLEQSENVLSYGLDLQGIADFSVMVRGQLPRPKIELNGRLSKMVLADQPTSDSTFKLNFLKDKMEGSGQFLGSTLNGEFVFPYSETGPFLLKVKSQKWDFTNLFSLVSKSAQQMDFSTSVGMDINLKADSGGFWNSTGRVDVSEFIIRKGGRSMRSEKPMALVFNQGVVNSENFSITSGDSYLKLDVAALAKNDLNASLNGKLDLTLLGLFTPFISDLRGNMAVSMDLKGTAADPDLSGSAYIDKGYAKFNDFYHPFSNIRADILFNDNEILLNSVRCELAGGRVAGGGKITFEKDKRPVDVKATFNDVKINVPENFRTQGSGTVAIHGDGFPYTMDINYQVSGGRITYEFGEGSAASNSVKASAYLPKFLDQNSFHPFTFVADVNLNSPVLVDNSLMNTNITGRAHATGTPDRLIINGSFSPLPGGKVFAQSQVFDINSAYIEYNNAPPNDPKLNLTATTRATENVIDEQGRGSQTQYDVTMLVQGHGQAPEISFASQPPLGQREIVSLLALGVTGSNIGNDDRKTSELQNANTSAALGAALLSRAGGKRVKENFGVDVKVSSSQPTPDNASSPKVTLSKQWTPKFGASASSTIQSNPNNTVKLEYKMNQNVSVIGSWEGREAIKEQQKDSTANVLGLDLQYKVQFK